MQLKSHKSDDQIYVDKNQKIQWIWAKVGFGQIKTLVQKTQWPLKIFVLILIAGLLAGVILARFY